MNESLQSENRSALAGIASTIAFPYLWLSMFVFLWWLYKLGFFGRDWGGILILVVLGLVCLIPAVPLALTRFVVRPLFSNLLAREVISHAGCVTGLVSIGLAGFATIYGLSRGWFGTILLLLIAAPVVGGLLAGGVSLLQRGGFHLPVSRGRAAPRAPASTVAKPSSTALPSVRKPPMISASTRPALPPSSRPTALPVSRRSTERPASRPASSRAAPVRRPPPRRKP